MTDKEWIEASGGVITRRGEEKGFVNGIGAEWPDEFRCAVISCDGLEDAYRNLRKLREDYLTKAA